MHDEHPRFYVQNFLKGIGDISEVQLGVYTYVPRSIYNSRRLYVTEPENLIHTFDELNPKLEPQEEIAFQSRVILDNHQTMHVALLDFKTSQQTYAEDFCKRTIRHLRIQSGLLVNSGHSFHGYFPRLLTPDAWERFLWFGYTNGTYLTEVESLDKVKLLEQVTDDRWFAHQSIARFSALRWSGNTKPMPRIIKEISI